MDFLRALYHQMVLALPHDLPPMDQQMPSTFKELSMLVQEQMARLTAALKSNTDRVSHAHTQLNNASVCFASAPDSFLCQNQAMFLTK